MATIARNLRPFLRSVRNNVRNYAEAAPRDDQMKFTFAGANQVTKSYLRYISVLQVRF